VGAKLIGERCLAIPVCEMKDGQVGVITEWVGLSKYLGIIVQRYEDTIIPIGRNSEASWLLRATSGCRVRILKPGETIEITE
jgi:hypothetical protein